MGSVDNGTVHGDTLLSMPTMVWTVPKRLCTSVTDGCEIWINRYCAISVSWTSLDDDVTLRVIEEVVMEHLRNDIAEPDDIRDLITRWIAMCRFDEDEQAREAMTEMKRRLPVRPWTVK